MDNNRIGQHIGQYKVLEKIGQGGMAEIYKGIHPALERYVAIKLLGRSLQVDANLTQRFQREARAIAALRHPNIVQVYDFGVQDDQHYMVMEYIEGSDLRAEIDRRQSREETFSHKEILSIASQIAAALDYAHEHGVVHRDIKPGNILLDKKGNAILTDFGLVMLQNRLSQATLGETFGTPEYIAPEQAMNSGAATAKSDIYSLGGLVYEMITGHLPFEGESALNLALKHISEEPTPPTTYVPDLAPEVEKALLQALAKQPEERYPTAGAFVDALGKAWEEQRMDTTVVAHIPPAEKPPEKKRRMSWVWVLLAVLCIGGLGGYLAIGQGKPLGELAYLIPGREPTATATITPLPTEVPPTPTPTLTVTPQPTATPTPTAVPPTPTATYTPAPTPTPTLAPGQVITREVDKMAMRFIPGGVFLMGSPEDDPDDRGDEQPQHEVMLSPFWMDETEVTIDQYKLCVADGVCEEPYTRTDYDAPDKGNYPMSLISWEQALTYCTWVANETGWDVTLPTEAQWEKAASWDPDTETKRIYPWGDTLDMDRLQLGSRTTAVGSYPEGASAYGILDLAGNVREWVLDWYNKDTYGREGPITDPAGPETGTVRVSRGGSFGSQANYDYQLQTTGRVFGYPESTAVDRPAKSADLGFRCVINAEFLAPY
ncbi:MAG: SUMF1/EgtB/PvdO family nonheme iron enzyme [Anaerolineae bacterium]|nr:SUMF1/EgtB/PvdO family nonheme iron enzyme [Anaerolineae bacterium]